MDLKTLKALAVRVGALLLANVREVIFLVGLSLIAGGLALVFVPVALIVPGSILVWLAIPPRNPGT